MALFCKLKKLFGLKKEVERTQTTNQHKHEEFKFEINPKTLYFGFLLAVEKIDFSYMTIPSIGKPVVLGTIVDFDSNMSRAFSCYIKTKDDTFVNVFNNIEVDYVTADHLPVKCQDRFRVMDYQGTSLCGEKVYLKVGLHEPRQLTAEQINEAKKAKVKFTKEDIEFLCSSSDDLERGFDMLVSKYMNKANNCER